MTEASLTVVFVLVGYVNVTSVLYLGFGSRNIAPGDSGRNIVFLGIIVCGWWR